MILLSVSMTLLLLRNNCIPLHQSSNFIQSPSNHPGSGTMLLDTSACTFSWLIPAIVAGTADISVSVHSSLVEASSVICRDPSCSNNALILFVLLELIIVPSHSDCYTCFVFSTDNAISFRLQVHPTAPLLQGELVNTLPNVITLSLSSGYN